MENTSNPSSPVKRKRRIRANRAGTVGRLAFFKNIYVGAIDIVISMTTLANRTYLERYLKSAAAKAKVNDEVVVLAFLDLDGFKYIDGSVECDRADKVLKNLAQGLRERCREGDLIARHGWDEFVIVFVAPAVYRNEVVARIKEIIRASFDQIPKNFDQNKIRATLGISVYPHPAPSVSLLLQTADQSRNRIKRNGEAFVIHEYTGEDETAD